MAIQNTEEKKYTHEEFLAIAEQSEERLELINGEIVSQAAPGLTHQRIVGKLNRITDSYIERNKGRCTPISAPFDVVLGNHVVQPDFMVICNPVILNEKRCNGAPDWVVEVTSSNAQRDYAEKFLIYRELV